MFRDQVLFENIWLSLLVHPYVANDDLKSDIIYQSQGVIHSEYKMTPLTALWGMADDWRKKQSSGKELWPKYRVHAT